MNTHHGYLIEIFWSAEDAAYVARVPALKGCISHGDSYAEAAANIEEAIELYLEDMLADGESPPAPDLAREEIGRMRGVLSVSKLARAAGLNRHTLASKLRRQTPFSPAESKAILAALDKSEN